jgi:ATP-dependent RNA helicase RhlE
VAPEEEKYLADIERLLKKTVQIVSADGFDPSSVRAERAPRATRASSAERPPRVPSGPRSEHADRPPRSQTSGEPRATRPPRAHSGEDRPARPPREDPRIERERAYALNPDQPPVVPNGNATAPDSAASTNPPKRRGFGHGRPVPALLMKRNANEPEKV